MVGPRVGAIDSVGLVWLVDPSYQAGRQASGWLRLTAPSSLVIGIRYTGPFITECHGFIRIHNIRKIRGTPTIRVFHPLTAPNHLDSSFYGFEVPVKHDLEFFKVTNGT